MGPRRSKTTYTETVQDEVCVYEWTRHEVHALNATAASVWELCDGKTSVAEMTERLSARQLPHAAELVGFALEEFKRKHLLDADPGFSIIRPAISRRTLIQRGVTAALLPVVTSIVAPTPLQAQSPGARSQTFAFTGASQTFVVPTGVTALTVSFGAQGQGLSNIPAGLGGSVTAILTVAPGETLIVVVGGAPTFSGSFTPYIPGFNGGGTGGSVVLRFGGPGGGASDVRRGGSALGNRVVVAGGGGGAGTTAAATGGGGGGTTGQTGAGFVPQQGGGGGTQTAGGVGGVGLTGAPSTDGLQAVQGLAVTEAFSRRHRFLRP